MASEEHLDILWQGVGIWNQWRKEYPWIRVDLSQISIDDAEFSDVELSDADLHDADLRKASLSQAKLNRVNLSGADLSGAGLRETDLRWADLRQANLSGADLIKANLSEANLQGAYLERGVLRYANLHKTIFRQANLWGADLTGANLCGADLARADLTYTKLRESLIDNRTKLDDKWGLVWSIINSGTHGLKLTGVDLSKAELSTADLSDANLSNANLKGADLSYVNLSSAKLLQTNLSEAIFGRTIIGDVDLSKVIGLDSAKHESPSTVGIDTIYRSQGKIPEVFLRGVGVPDSFITYMHSLTDDAIQYYKCFISYSSKDDEFARRLYDNLQGQGVRCWFAPEDLKWGAETRQGIDHAIRLHDKLLLVLSEHSVASRWVQKEVETAFEEEQRQGKLILFPIRLDTAVMETSQAWAADIRRMRNIGDFSRWKDHDAYQGAFERLLRDLKAET